MDQNTSASAIIEIINNKCSNKLGHEVISSISKTAHNKTMVKFVDGSSMNFCTYKSAFEYLNAAYNLKIKTETKVKVLETYEHSVVENSKIEIVVRKLKRFIKSFDESNYSVKLNNMILSDYLESYEWKANNFNSKDIDDIIDHIENSRAIANTRYANHIIKCLNKNYFY